MNLSAEKSQFLGSGEQSGLRWFALVCFQKLCFGFWNEISMALMDRQRVGAVWEFQMFLVSWQKTKQHISRYTKLSRWKHLESKGNEICASRHEAECTLGWNGPVRDQVCKCMKPIISTWAMSRHSTMCKHCQEHATLVLFRLKCTCTTACARITSVLIQRSDKWWLIAATLCGEHSGDSLAL